MDFAELNRYRSIGTQYEPVLLTVKSTRDLDRVRSRMLAGQVVAFPRFGRGTGTRTRAATFLVNSSSRIAALNALCSTVQDLDG